MAELVLGRLKFHWAGDWTPTTEYIKDDVVKYGPSAYVCTANHTSTSEFDFTKFELMAEGVAWAGEWNDSTSYQVNDIVNYGGAIYICILDHGPGDSTDTSPNSQDFWSRLVGGVEWDGNYDNSTEYQRGDIVRYGGYTYINLQPSTGNAPTDTLYWDILNRGYRHVGTYQSSTTYLPGELANFGGRIYACHTTSQGNEPTEVAYWFLFADGTKWRGDFDDNSVEYAIGDIVKYGPRTYINILGYTSTGLLLADNPTYWTLHTDGQAWEGTYSHVTTYKPGEIVNYGARNYICTATSYQHYPTDASYWDLFSDGQQWADNWASGVAYKIGDIVRYGARSYICIDGHTSASNVLPTDSLLWGLLNKGLDWKGTWINGAEYKLDDVVEYSGSSYVCIQPHNTSLAGNPSTEATYWESLAQGDISSPMTATGDIIYRNAGGAVERLPIGGAGSFLVVNNGLPSWGVRAPEQNFYVSLTGDDANDGRTPATAWRTLHKAATETYNYGQCKISVFSGTYEEQCPIKLGRAVVVEGDGLGAVTVSPNNTVDNGFGVGISDDGSTPNANSFVFHVNNGTRIRNIVFRGFSNGAVCVSLDPGSGPDDTSVWITSQSPYVQNCTSFTDGGTGMIIDGALHNGGYKSIVANDWTQINSDGYGMIVRNDGRSELVSCFTYYCDIGYLAESGGKIRAIQGNNSYGTYGSVAKGYSQAETPLVGLLQLDDDTLNSIATFGSNVQLNASYKGAGGETYWVGHTNPTSTGPTSSWNNAASYPFITKLDSGGGVSWIYTYESAYGSLNSIVEFDDQVYCGGVVYDAATNKGFLLKINTAGEIGWQKTLGDTDKVIDLTTDQTTYLYALSNHTTYGTSVSKVQPSGIISWSKALDYNDSSVDTVAGTSICYAVPATSSTETYTAEGDATAEDDLFISLYDSTAGEAIIARMTDQGSFVTSYTYGDFYINKLRLDSGNGDGIYMLAAGYYDAGAVNKNPLAMRISIDGEVEWQAQSALTTSEGEFIDVLPLGGDIYFAGYINDSTNAYSRGMAARYTSTGSQVWNDYVTNSTNDVWFNSVILDGVNVELGGNDDSNGLLVNIQRDLENGIGTVTSGSYAIAQTNPTVTSTTIATKAIQAIDDASVNIATSDTSLTLNQSPSITRTVAATRAGFAGIGTGVNFTVNSVYRQPKQGSVVQIYGDEETYFCIGVEKYLAPTITSGNYPNAIALLDANRTFLQAEVIAYVNNTYSGLVYNEELCYRDVGLIVDALSHDLDYNTNGETVDAALTYYNNASSLVAITTQQTETLAAIAHLKSVALDVIQDNAVTPTTGNGVSQVRGTAGEAGAVTLLGNNVDIITNVINEGEAVAPDKTGYGSCTIALDPAIPSNKTPSDGTRVIFREAFSQVRMTGHDFLDIGTGGFALTNYPVIIASDYSQAPDQTRETLSEDGGRVFYVTTDQDGNFRVGDYFKVEQATGRSTINAQEFNLSGLNELQLGSITAGRQGATVNEFSTDGTMSGNSDTAVPTERAVKTYVDTKIGGASQLKAGSAPNESTLEITGDGSVTDTIDFNIAGTLVAQIASQYQLVPKGNGTTDRPSSPVSGWLRFNTDINALEVYNGSAWVPAGGLSNVSVDHTASPYTAATFQFLYVDTSVNAVTVNLPSSANQGDQIRFIDVAGSFATNNLTIGRNGLKIFGLLDDITVNTTDASFSLVYTGATYGWKLMEL